MTTPLTEASSYRYCPDCDAHITVTLQLPVTTPLNAVAADLAPVEFEAEVLHLLARHLDGLGAA